VTRFEFEPIGYVTSCFKEKFGIPRQPGLIPEARGELQIVPPYNHPDAFRELTDYSHVWLTFVFHANLRQQWKPTVRPPRLGGNQRVGVFASRSPFRPNPLGLSVVRLDRLELESKRVTLYLSGIDLMDGTPVLDVKPYIPYADSIIEARSGYAQTAPTEEYEIRFSPAAEQTLETLPSEEAEPLRHLIRHILALDPRPGYRRGTDEQRRYGMRLYDYDLHWEIEQNQVTVVDLVAGTDRSEP
jgi:tRNA-Thr(GGU) m(6)t(6)A37 methyltransferase TsaA